MRKAAPKDEEKKETPVEEEKKDSPAQDTEPPADKPKEEPASGEEKPQEEPAGEKEEAPDKPEEEKASDDAQADENAQCLKEQLEGDGVTVFISQSLQFYIGNSKRRSCPNLDSSAFFDVGRHIIGAILLRRYR